MLVCKSRLAKVLAGKVLGSNYQLANLGWQFLDGKCCDIPLCTRDYIPTLARVSVKLNIHLCVCIAYA